MYAIPSVPVKRTPQDEMVERAALALRLATKLRGAPLKSRDAARIVIASMREPTAEMIGIAGAGVLNQYVGADPADTYYGTAGWADECWQAMISAVLPPQFFRFDPVAKSLVPFVPRAKP